jgi:hypothetical protein
MAKVEKVVPSSLRYVVKEKAKAALKADIKKRKVGFVAQLHSSKYT